MLVEWSWPGSLMHLRVGWGFCFSVGLVVGQVCSARLPSPQDQWDSPGSPACGSGRSTREQIETCKTFWCLDSEGVNGCPTAIEPRKLHGQNHNQQPAFYVRESVKIQRKMVDCIRGRQENWDGDQYLSEPFKAPVGVYYYAVMMTGIMTRAGTCIWLQTAHSYLIQWQVTSPPWISFLFITWR